MRTFILICTDKWKENVVSFLMCRHRLDQIEKQAKLNRRLLLLKNISLAPQTQEDITVAVYITEADCDNNAIRYN